MRYQTISSIFQRSNWLKVRDFTFLFSSEINITLHVHDTPKKLLDNRNVCGGLLSLSLFSLLISLLSISAAFLSLL